MPLFLQPFHALLAQGFKGKGAQKPLAFRGVVALATLVVLHEAQGARHTKIFNEGSESAHRNVMWCLICVRRHSECSRTKSIERLRDRNIGLQERVDDLTDALVFFGSLLHQKALDILVNVDRDLQLLNGPVEFALFRVRKIVVLLYCFNLRRGGVFAIRARRNRLSLLNVPPLSS